MTPFFPKGVKHGSSRIIITVIMVTAKHCKQTNNDKKQTSHFNQSYKKLKKKCCVKQCLLTYV